MGFHYPDKPSAQITELMFQQLLKALITAPFAELARKLTGVDPATLDTPEKALDAIVEHLGVDLDSLLAAVDGTYDGDDPAWVALAELFGLVRRLLELLGGVGSGDLPSLGQLEDGFGDLAAAVGGLIEGLFKIPLWQLDNGGVEVVDRFDGLSTVDAIEGWSWDDADGHDADGCALFTASGTPGVLLSPTPVEVREGEQYTVSAWAKATGTSGGGIALGVQWYDAEHVALSTSTAQTVGSPSASWTELSGTVTVPAGAKYARRMLRCENTAGEVRWDDVRFKGEATTIPQTWVNGLADALQGVIDWVGQLVDELLGALGIPVLGELTDRISDLADEIGAWLDDTQDRAAELSDLIGDLLANPASVIGTLPQTLISNASGWVSTALGNAQTAADQAETIAQQIASNVNEAIADGVKVGTGAVETVFDTIADLFGLAKIARDIALTAQSQVQDLTNDSQLPGGVDGIVWSTQFGGAVDSALPSGDWDPISGLVIKDSGYVGIADASASNSHHYAGTVAEFGTDSQSASMVLGPPRGKTGWDTLRTGLYIRANSTFTTAAYVHVRPDNVYFGKMTRSGSTFTFTQLATAATPVKQGDLIRLRCHDTTYHVVVNGITRLSFTDSGATISSGASYRRGAISEQRGTFSDFFGSWTNDSWRVAGYAMSDWLPAGVNVTVPSWRLRRGSGAEVAKSISHGGQDVMPSGFYTVQDLAAGGVTVSDLGTGQVKVPEDGWYEISATSINRDNFSTRPADTQTATYEAGDNTQSWRASPWVLYADGVAIAGPIMPGVSTTIYLAAGQIVRPGVSASSPLVGVGAFSSEAYSNPTQTYKGRSAITHVSGSPSASFTGRKVA